MKNLTSSQINDLECVGYEIEELETMPKHLIEALLSQPFQIEADLDNGIGCKGGQSVRLEVNCYIGEFPSIEEYEPVVKTQAFKRYGESARNSEIISMYWTD